jgi:hypothetical protein
MKKTAIALLLLTVFAGAFTPKSEPKKYHVDHTVADWQSVLKYIDNAKQIMSKSTLPANVVGDWTDSLTKAQQDIISQLQPQIAADTVKSKTK